MCLHRFVSPIIVPNDARRPALPPGAGKETPVIATGVSRMLLLGFSITYLTGWWFAIASATESHVEPRCRVFLHGPDDMGIGVEGDSDVRMSEAFLNNFGMNTGDKELRRVRMPQIMIADIRDV
jgi:hypothetical protein